jgi:hypothetical protein
MARFQFLPAETKFYEWFEKATANLLEAAEALQDLLDNYEQVEHGAGAPRRLYRPRSDASIDPYPDRSAGQRGH